MKSHKAIIASVLAATLCAVSPMFASASDHGSSSSGSTDTRTDSAPAPAPAPAPEVRSDSVPAPAPAPEVRSDSAPAPAPAPEVRSDSAPAPAAVDRSASAPAERSAPAPVERSAPAAAEHSVTSPVTNVSSNQAAPQPPRPPRRVPVPTSPRYQPRTPVHNNQNTNGEPANNSNEDSSEWDWDYGAAWVGSTSYWGDGFWGPLVAGLSASAYIVGPGSPGAQLLQSYGLTQTPCGPPNLVEILGPGASEICAMPTDHVPPGVYHVDTQSLTLISSS
ncbi:MAG TPA: hypothetical protein VMG98_03815 [Verrucomicrobiae bacterium]|nr:hypothetical protein [Verrucomicrobiae bacterium]